MSASGGTVKINKGHNRKPGMTVIQPFRQECHPDI